MKKLLLISGLFVGTAFSSSNLAHAQLSLGVTGGIFNQGVSSDGERYSNNLLGFNLAGKFGLNDNKMRVGLNIGYFFDSEDGLTIFTQPITGLFEYSFSDASFSPYAGIDAGIYRMGASSDGGSASESELGFAPVAGFNYEISDRMDLNVNIKYMYILTDGNSTTGVNANAGIVIKF